MKITLSAILLLVALNVCAQDTTNSGRELPRRSIKPYATVEEALVSSDAPSRYITPLTGWKRTEKDGNVIFTTSYVYPAAWLNRQLLVRIDSASSGYIISANGSEVGRSANGTHPAEFNVTKKSVQGVNELQITIPSESPTAAILPHGPAALGRVAIISQPTIRVRDVDTSTHLNDNGDGVAEFNIVVKTDALNPKTSRIHYELLAPDTTRLAYGYKDLTLEMRGEDTVSFATIVPAKWLWSIHRPSLLRLVVRNQVEGRYVENIAVPVGLREVEYSDGKLSVNAKSAALRAATVPATISAQEISDLKVQGYNALMVKAGEAADALYARCDSVGIYAIPQTAIDTSQGASHIGIDGNPSNDPAWKEHYLSRTGEMYHTAKTHPSVVAFSLGGGRTNGINLYESYLMLKKLEEHRPIIYLGAGGEWNSDTIEGSVLPETGK